MTHKANKNLELKKLEEDYNNKITDLAVVTTKSSELFLSKENDYLHTKIKRELQIDSEKLVRLASDLIEDNENLSNEEVAIELLKEVAKNGKSKTMRKLAAKIVKEKWWQK